MSVTLAEVLQRFGAAYLGEHGLSRAQARVWRAIVACRTEALGGQRLRCEQCDHEVWRWHSCRNRHCPRCQARAQDAWRRARLAELLDVPYTHLVFTLPHDLNELARAQPRWVYETLLRSVADTLLELAANPRWLGAQPAFSLVLHTWTQDLRLHVHAHALMACGGLGADGQWHRPTRGERFLFPVTALSKVFAGKFLCALQQAEREGRLPRDPQATPLERARRRQALQRHAWVVYAKTPLAGPAAVVDYLSRYTHRTAVSHERLLGLDAQGVCLRVRDREAQTAAAGKRSVHLPGAEFIARFLQHVLPSGFKRIRHYGLLAAAHKRTRLAQAQTALGQPHPQPQAMEAAADFMHRVAQARIDTCPHCHVGHWRCVGHQPAQPLRWPQAQRRPAQAQGP